MNMNGTTFRFIFYDILTESPINGIPFLYSRHIDQLKNLIQYNKQYRIILICKAEHIQELYNIMVEHYIHEVFILGDCKEFNIKDKNITMINTNEQDLKFHVLCTAVRYTHNDEIIQRKQENFGVANVLKMDVLELLEQIEILL